MSRPQEDMRWAGDRCRRRARPGCTTATAATVPPIGMKSGKSRDTPDLVRGVNKRVLHALYTSAVVAVKHSAADRAYFHTHHPGADAPSRPRPSRGRVPDGVLQAPSLLQPLIGHLGDRRRLAPAGGRHARAHRARHDLAAPRRARPGDRVTAGESAKLSCAGSPSLGAVLAEVRTRGAAFDLPRSPI